MLKFTDDFENNEKLILRDHLALERTKLANERTLFSYIRTSLYLLTAGIGIFQIENISRLDGLAWVCIICGIFIFILGFVRFMQMRRHLKSYIKTSSKQQVLNNFYFNIVNCLFLVLFPASQEMHFLCTKNTILCRQKIRFNRALILFLYKRKKQYSYPHKISIIQLIYNTLVY